MTEYLDQAIRQLSYEYIYFIDIISNDLANKNLRSFHLQYHHLTICPFVRRAVSRILAPHTSLTPSGISVCMYWNSMNKTTVVMETVRRVGKISRPVNVI